MVVSTWAYTMNHFPHTRTHGPIAGFSSSGCHLPTNIKGGHCFTPPPPQRHRRLSERLTVELQETAAQIKVSSLKKKKSECDAAPASSVHDSMITLRPFLSPLVSRPGRERPPPSSLRPPSPCCSPASAWQTVDSQKMVPPSGTRQGGRSPPEPTGPTATPRPPTGPVSPAPPTWPPPPTLPGRTASTGSSAALTL